jgi:hypothetical protein
MTSHHHRPVIGYLLDKPLSENERAWIGFIRLLSDNADPSPTLATVQALRQAFVPS